MKKTQQGFSLIELAIVLVIVTILIGGLAVPLSAQIEARRIAETRKIMEEAREAIIGYAMSHPTTSSTCQCTYTVGDTGTCPVTLSPVTPPACSSLCPAVGDIALTLPSCPAPNTGSMTLTRPINRHYLPCPDTDGDGTENRNVNDCSSFSGTISSGFLPWVDLGVAPQDAWGNRLRYAVVKTLADKTTGFSSSSSLNDPLVICSTNTCAAVTPDVANNLAVVLVSHGPNGWGAQNVNNPPLTLLASPSGLDEAANLDADRKYVSRSPTSDAAASGEFDDLVASISFNQLVTRVCPTGCP